MMEWKRYQILKKGFVELRNGQRIPDYPCPDMFFELFKPIKFSSFFESGKGSECWPQKVFMLGLSQYIEVLVLYKFRAIENCHNPPKCNW